MIDFWVRKYRSYLQSPILGAKNISPITGKIPNRMEARFNYWCQGISFQPDQNPGDRCMLKYKLAELNCYPEENNF